MTSGVDGPIRYCATPEFLFGIMDLDEAGFAGICGSG